MLNQSYEPITVCSAKKAFLLIYLLKAELVEVRTNKSIRTINRAFPYPSVIKLVSYIKMPYKRIDLSRKNILKRDNHRCQYCGKKTLDITIDHIIPKSRGGMDTWDNLVAACVRCNNRKGNRTPDEAGMKLLSKPRRPNHIMFLKQYIGRTEDSWRPFLFMD
ncbi:MAG: HNH endonuclease [Candidatus Kapabacteria bacterium]|nr:HNH endonuclease [Candidatus Kapabacteria bacterium]